MRRILGIGIILALAACGQPGVSGSAQQPSTETIAPTGETVAAAASTSPAPRPAPAWIVDKARSSIVVNGFMNKTRKPQSGTFQRWDAQIKFDPADLAHASAVVTVQTGSFKTGNTFYDGALPDPDWLGTDKFPTATFAAKSFSALGGGRYQAKGALTIKGASFPVTLPFTVAIKGDDADMKGALPLDLDTLGMGKANDPSREYAAKAVTVNVAVHATRG